jgi:hypothetical protein
LGGGTLLGGLGAGAGLARRTASLLFCTCRRTRWRGLSKDRPVVKPAGLVKF